MHQSICTILHVFLVLTSLSCQHQKPQEIKSSTVEYFPEEAVSIEPGSKISPAVLSHAEFYLGVTSSASIDRIHVAEQGGVKYGLCVDSTNHIEYIQTTDASFETEEGIRRSSTFGPMRNELGWAFWIPLKSGWKAAFQAIDSLSEMTAHQPSPDATVSFFFKR